MVLCLIHVRFCLQYWRERIEKMYLLRQNKEKLLLLVGPSGGGKTTVSRLAARFWDINKKGKITVGGMDISKNRARNIIIIVVLYRISRCNTV